MCELSLYRMRNGAALILCLILMAGCSTPTPYAPATDRFGYKQSGIEEHRYRVSFRGNSATDRETVETYLLYRAAELTVESGGTFFAVVSRDLEKNERYIRHTYLPFAYGAPGFYGYHGGYYYRRAAFAGTTDSIPITRYEAIAEILVGGPELLKEGVNAYDARQVIGNLEPRIVRAQP